MSVILLYTFVDCDCGHQKDQEQYMVYWVLNQPFTGGDEWRNPSHGAQKNLVVGATVPSMSRTVRGLPL